MHFSLTRTYGRARWGIYTNLWPTKLCRLDRQYCGPYFDLHTPWRVLEICW